MLLLKNTPSITNTKIQSMRTILILAVLACTPLHYLLAQGNWRLGGGNSFPFERLTDVASPDTFTNSQGALVQLAAKAEEVGWNGIIRYTANIADNTGWTFFTGLHHFTNSNVLIIEPSRSNTNINWATISQSVVPVGTGIEYRVLNLWFIHGYVAADAACHVFMPRSLQATSRGMQSDGAWFGRGGASVGLGMDVMFWTFGVDVSARYHVVNLVGRSENEALRSFVSLNFSLVFGEKK
jgi:hypothetical protein